eukprot:926919-Pelagomonas_calceolata.AAC.1
MKIGWPCSPKSFSWPQVTQEGPAAPHCDHFSFPKSSICGSHAMLASCVSKEKEVNFLPV